MTRRLSTLLFAILLGLVTFSPALAFPPNAFSGGATSQSLDLSLDLTVAELSIGIGALNGVQNFDGDNLPTTSGDGDGVDVVVELGDPALGVDLINVASEHTYGDGPNPSTDSASLLEIDTILVDAGVAELDTLSLTTDNSVESELNWSLAGLTVHGDILGVTDLVAVDELTGTAETREGEGGVVNSIGTSHIKGLAIEVPLVTTLELVTADQISTTARARSDGTEAGAAAYANTEFLNLRVQGELIGDVPAGTVIDLEALNVNIGQVIIRPVEETSASTNASSAAAVALRVTILPLLGLIGADIDIGMATADASVPTTPTAVTVSDMQITTGSALPYAIIGLGMLAGVAVWAARRRAN